MIKRIVYYSLQTTLWSITLGLVLVGIMLYLLAFKDWHIDRPYIATRSFGFAEQMVDRDSSLGHEVRYLQFVCPGQNDQRFSLNQMSSSVLLVVTCDKSEFRTTIPWWYPFAFSNLPPLPYKTERSDKSLRWQDRA